MLGLLEEQQGSSEPAVITQQGETDEVREEIVGNLKF